MKNFTYSIPTTVEFGEGQISHLADLKNYGSRVLVVYGGGSIKRNGVYDQAMHILSDAGLTVYELAGVEPNPRITSVREGAAICKENQIEMVLALGGGSTLDCAKVIAAAAVYDGDAWDLVLDSEKIVTCLPIFSVMTMAATGSEMNKNAVISDLDSHDKIGTHSALLKPKMTVLDPTYMFTLPERQTAAGTADIMSHTFENYFTFVPGEYQAQFAESVLRICIDCGKIALAQPDNYEARANLMWASNYAINGVISLGSASGWSVHPMEHELSAYYDITHGIGLAILTPAWMEKIMEIDERTIPLLARYGRNVWGLGAGPTYGDKVQDADSYSSMLSDVSDEDRKIAAEAIEKTRDFFTNDLKIPARLRDAGVPDESLFGVMSEKIRERAKGMFIPLTPEDVVDILHRAF